MLGCQGRKPRSSRHFRIPHRFPGRRGTPNAAATRIEPGSAGVRPNDEVVDASLARFRNHRVTVDAWLRVPGATGVYAIGDVASPKLGDQGELPMLSPPAMQGGRYVAQTIVDAVRGNSSSGQTVHPLIR